jgi:hypothetical protein
MEVGSCNSAGVRILWESVFTLMDFWGIPIIPNKILHGNPEAVKDMDMGMSMGIGMGMGMEMDIGM